MAPGVVCPGEEDSRSSGCAINSIRRNHQCWPLHEGRLSKSDGADIPGPESCPASNAICRSLQTGDRRELCRSPLCPPERRLDLQGRLVDLESLLTSGEASRTATPSWRSDPNEESSARPQGTSSPSGARSSGSSNRISRDSNGDERSEHRPPTRGPACARGRSCRSRRSRFEDFGSLGDDPACKEPQGRFETRRGSSRR